MTRTLLISDLHLGARLGRDVLRRREALDGLLAGLEGVDRLVLLGDVVELLEGQPERALARAEPILREVGRRLGPGREVVVVPGNHDRALVARWVRSRGAALASDSLVPSDATTALARLAGWLGPARVEVRYPGVWLADSVWATHGHYLDRHLLPESAFGIARGALGRLPRDGALPADYEAGPHVTRLEALLTRSLPRPLALGFDDVVELLRAWTMPRETDRVLTRQVAAATSSALGFQMRRASIPALARVAHRLGVDADWVIFGHVHRSGPREGDDERRWTGPAGRPQIVNTGSWVYEPMLLHGASPPHPYWPGGAVVLEDGGPPRAVGLLDHLGSR